MAVLHTREMRRLRCLGEVAAPGGGKAVIARRMDRYMGTQLFACAR